MIAKKYQSLLNKLTPFIFTYKENLRHFNLEAMDLKISPEFCFNPTSFKSKTFYHYLKTMDTLTFGDQGMSMDGWVYFDCSTMPGAIVGFGLSASDLPVKLRSLFLNCEDNTFIPLSMYIAIPMVGNRWFGHNLSSLRSHLGDEFSGLGMLTKAYALQVLKIEEMFGATQWGSPAIHIHSRLADMDLISSLTAVHSHDNTLCYRSFYSKDKIDKALSPFIDERKEDFLISSRDSNKLFEIQNSLERGEELSLIGKPFYRDSLKDEVYYKLRRGLTSIAPK
jgi:hypothetical protein